MSTHNKITCNPFSDKLLSYIITANNMTFYRNIKKIRKKGGKFPLTPMGVLAPVSAQRDTSLRPPLTSAEI